jgi:hypothetical protein
MSRRLALRRSWGSCHPNNCSGDEPRNTRNTRKQRAGDPLNLAADFTCEGKRLFLATPSHSVSIRTTIHENVRSSRKFFNAEELRSRRRNAAWCQGNECQRNKNNSSDIHSPDLSVSVNLSALSVSALECVWVWLRLRRAVCFVVPTSLSRVLGSRGCIHSLRRCGILR